MPRAKRAGAAPESLIVGPELAGGDAPASASSAPNVSKATAVARATVCARRARSNPLTHHAAIIGNAAAAHTRTTLAASGRGIFWRGAEVRLASEVASGMLLSCRAQLRAKSAQPNEPS